METAYLDAFEPGCDMCPYDKKSKCADKIGEITALMQLGWPESLEYDEAELAALIDQKEKDLAKTAQKFCAGPWVLREENNMLVCGQQDGVVVIDLSGKMHQVRKYDRVEARSQGVQREKV